MGSQYALNIVIERARIYNDGFTTSNSRDIILLLLRYHAHLNMNRTLDVRRIFRLNIKELQEYMIQREQFNET